MHKPKISKYGEHAISLSWPSKIDPETHEEVISYEHHLNKIFKNEILETVSTYHSIVIFLHQKVAVGKSIDKIKKIDKTPSISEKRQRYCWNIPVCYDPDLGWDLKEVADHNNCTIQEVIDRHTNPSYRIYFTGFLPGFLYLGGLNENLITPRKKNTRLSVPKGAVAIGGNQTGVYPRESPGGWQIIGQTPVALFDAENVPPSPFNPGDTIYFQAINRDEFDAISTEVEVGIYKPTKARQK